jgi:hypothetical protein
MASLHLVGADVRHGGRQAPVLRHYGAKSGTARVGGPASLGTKPLELLGPGHFFRRPSSLHHGCTILDRMIRDDQLDGIVIAAEPREEASPRAGRPEVRGEFWARCGSQ